MLTEKNNHFQRTFFLCDPTFLLIINAENMIITVTYRPCFWKLNQRRDTRLLRSCGRCDCAVRSFLYLLDLFLSSKLKWWAYLIVCFSFFFPHLATAWENYCAYLNVIYLNKLITKTQLFFSFLYKNLGEHIVITQS